MDDKLSRRWSLYALLFPSFAQVLLQIDSTDKEEVVLINGPTGVVFLFRPAVRQQRKIGDCRFGEQYVAEISDGTEHAMLFFCVF